MIINKTLNKTLYEISNKRSFFEMFFYSVVSFFIPLLIGHPQIVVGITVNIALIMAAMNLKHYKILPVIILPSLGVLSRGLLFGPFTVFLLYMIPFIWIGNYLLVYFIKSLYVDKKKNYLFSLGVASGVKALFLFVTAFILFSLGLVPVVFLTAMGVMQFVTAFGAGFIAIGINKAVRK